MPRAPHAHGAATALPAVWPPALTSELNGSYSEALYGAAGRLPADLRVVWPSLLSDDARRALAGAVECRFHPRLPPNALHFTADAIQHQQAALWVHQRSDPPFAPTGTTLEVAHCAFAGVRGGDLVRPNSPMWFFVVPGSGVSVDVGRTLHASPERFGAARVGRMHKALVSGDYRNFHKQLRNLTAEEEVEAEVRCFSRRGVPSCFPALLEYDSVQFPGWKRRCAGCSSSELVMLAWGRELEFVTEHLDHLRCGRAPHELRPCTPTDAAVRQQGPSCLRAARRIPAVHSAKVVNNCSLPKPPDPGRHGDQWERRADAEATRLRSAHGLGDHAAVEADARGLNPILRPDGSVFVPEGARNKSAAHVLAKQWAAHVRHREEVRSRVVPTVGLPG